MSMQELKQALRQRIIRQRAQLCLQDRADYSARITASLLQIPEYGLAKAVLGYMNFGAEYQALQWVQRVLEDGKRLALPRVNRHTGQLDLYWVEDLENHLAAGSWGIREPLPELCTPLTAADELDFMLLPGVAFERCGARLGYGGGFYDKLLERLEGTTCKCCTLAAGTYSLQLSVNIPQDATDRKVQWLVTEHETVRCAV